MIPQLDDTFLKLSSQVKLKRHQVALELQLALYTASAITQALAKSVTAIVINVDTNMLDNVRQPIARTWGNQVLGEVFDTANNN